jgi:hypothetical protein
VNITWFQMEDCNKDSGQSDPKEGDLLEAQGGH